MSNSVISKNFNSKGDFIMRNKSEHKPDTLEVLRDAIIIRKKLTKMLCVITVQKGREHELLDKELATLQDKVEIEAKAKEISEKAFEFEMLKKDFDIINKTSHEITGNLRNANTIWPEYMAEFTARRVFLDNAIGACWVLIDELQYIAETVYADMNKFTALALDIDELLQKVKKLRQADNRFLKELKDFRDF